jgi:hypothetical protein
MPILLGFFRSDMQYADMTDLAFTQARLAPAWRVRKLYQIRREPGIIKSVSTQRCSPCSIAVTKER